MEFSDGFLAQPLFEPARSVGFRPAALRPLWSVPRGSPPGCPAGSSLSQSGPFPALGKLELLLTERCNLACSNCFEGGMRRQRSMSAEVARAALDLLFDYAGKGRPLHITYFGGEPTLNFSRLRQATEYAEKRAAELGKNLSFAVTTNGTVLDRRRAAYLAEHRIKVLLSLDGLEPSHDRYRRDRQGQGSFRQALAGLRNLQRVQGWIGVRMTVMPANASRLFNDVLGLYQPSPWLLAAKFRPAPRFWRWITGACWLPWDMSRHGLTHFHNRAELVSSVRLRQACEAQGLAATCSGGCFASNYEENGDLFQPSRQAYLFDQECEVWEWSGGR